MAIESVTAFRCSDMSVHPTLMIAEAHEAELEKVAIRDEVVCLVQTHGVSADRDDLIDLVSIIQKSFSIIRNI